MKKIIILLMMILSLNLFSSEKFLKYFFNNKEDYKVLNQNNLNGVKEKYYDNGKLKSKEFYISNKKYGRWQYFYESGKLKTEIFYEPMSKTELGYVINYDEEGKKLSVGRINNNEMIDIWQYFDEDENLIYTYDSTSGIITSYSKDAKILLKFKDTEMIGKLQEIEKEILDDKVKSKITP